MVQLIGAGMPRTGTQSLKKALEILGYQTYGMGVCVQYYSHLKAWELHAKGIKKASLPDLLDKYEATVGVPCCFYYPEMMEAFPEAKVIMCPRDPERWYRSFSNLRSLVFTLRRRLWFLPRIRSFFATVNAFMFQGFLGGKYDKEHTITLFQRHNEEVIKTVPKEKLLVFEITEGWEPLCQFLGKPVPDVPFPHMNKFERVVRRRVGLAILRDLGYFSSALLGVAALYYLFSRVSLGRK